MRKYSNLQAEAEVLGAIFHNDDFLSEIMDYITADHFTSEENRNIYKAATIVYTGGNRVVLNNTRAELMKINPSHSGEHFMDVAGTFTGMISAKEAVKSIVEINNKNEIYTSLITAQKELDQKTSFQISEMLLETSDKVQNNESKDNFIADDESMEEVLNSLEESMATGKMEKGMLTGWQEIDASTNGFERGQLVIIGARPSIGKSAFALNLSERLNRRGFKGAIFSLEMTHKKLMMRRLGIRTHVKINDMTYGRMHEDEWKRWTFVANDIPQKKMMFVDDRGGLTINQIRKMVKKAKYKHNIDFIIVDHINIIDGPSNKKKIEIVTEASMKLKAMAKDFDITVFALSQLSRASESSSDGKPQLHHLRESGSIEQDADIVMLLHRDREEQIGVNTVEFEVNIAKNRDGRTGPIKFEFNLASQFMDEKWD